MKGLFTFVPTASMAILLLHSKLHVRQLCLHQCDTVSHFFIKLLIKFCYYTIIVLFILGLFSAFCYTLIRFDLLAEAVSKPSNVVNLSAGGD